VIVANGHDVCAVNGYWPFVSCTGDNVVFVLQDCPCFV
jgi:hypothetical protein